MDKHVPSPWDIGRISIDPGGDLVHVVSRGHKAGEILIAEVYEVWQPWDMTANARLIAAAPDLLKELEMKCSALDAILAYGWVKPDHRVSAIRESVAKGRAVISKVRGGS